MANEDKPLEWYVTYDVGDKTYEQGPFPLPEAFLNRDDIAGYEGITKVKLVPRAIGERTIRLVPA